MMNMIREIGISICVTAVAGAIFQGLLPKSGMEKTARFVLSIFFLSCIIVPFAGFDFSSLESLTVVQTGDSNVPDSTLQETVNQKLSQLTEQTVAQTARSVLQQNQIEPKEIDVETTIDENNSIVINKITIAVNWEDMTAAELLAGSLADGDETKVEFLALG